MLFTNVEEELRKNQKLLRYQEKMRRLAIERNDFSSFDRNLSLIQTKQPKSPEISFGLASGDTTTRAPYLSFSELREFKRKHEKDKD